MAIVAKGRLLREAPVREILGSTDSLLVKAEPVEAAARALSGEWESEIMTGGLRVRALPADAPAVLRRLHAAQIDVYGLSAEDRSLEDIFLTMTKDADA